MKIQELHLQGLGLGWKLIICICKKVLGNTVVLRATVLSTTEAVVSGFPGDSVIKNLPANSEDARDVGSILKFGRFPRVGNGNQLPDSCLENPKDRGAWRTTNHGVHKPWG